MRASLLLGIVCGGFLLCGITATPAVAQDVAGPGVPIEATDNGEPIDEITEFIGEETDFFEPQGALLVFGEDGNTHVVIPYGQPEPGYVTVEQGFEVEHPTLDVSIIVAEQMSVETNAEDAELSSVRANPEKYGDDVYGVEGQYQQISTRFDPSEDSFDSGRPEAVGGFGDSLNITNDYFNAVTWATVNSSWSLNDSAVERPTPDSDLLVYYPSESFWIDGQTRVEGMAVDLHDYTVPDIFYDGGVLTERDGYVFIATSVSPIAEREVAPQDISEGEIAHGSKVTVRTTFAKNTFSVRDEIVDSAPCGPNIVVFPPTGCLPLWHDTTITTGIGGTSLNNSMLFVGASNREPSFPLPASTGRYEVTGEVVSAESMGLDLSIGGFLRVESIEQVSSDPPSEELKNLSRGFVYTAIERINQYDPSETAVVRSEGVPVVAAQPVGDIRLANTHFVNRWGDVGDEVVVETTVVAPANISAQSRLIFAAAGNEFYNETITLNAGETREVRATFEISGQSRQAVTVGGNRLGMAGYNESALATETPDGEVEIANSPGESTSDGGVPPLALSPALAIVYILLKRR
jgi:hypothetical protein